MGRAPSHKSRAYKGKKMLDVVCNQQYPDCPTIPNFNDCHTCPLWGTGLSKSFKEKEVNQTS